MRMPIKTALVALALAGSSFITGHSALADNVTVAVGPAGGVAFGYSDGYWDRAHQWHAWRNAEEASSWREANRDHYYEYRHDRDASMGWHEEHWWEHH